VSPCARRWGGRIGPPPAMATSLRERARWAGPRIVRRRRDGRGCARRQRRKGWPGGDAPQRGVPCRHLAPVIPALLAAGPPVVRIDTTQKADGGTLSRAGTGAGPQALNACDHACPRRAPGGLIPPGLDARARPQGWRHGGRSRDPTACACDRLRLLWPGDGQRVSPHASARLLLGAGGGRHRGPTPLGQAARQGVVNDLAVPSRVAHAPASGATGNPSARRLGSQVTSAWQGGLFDSLPTVLGLRHKPPTPQGLTVTGRVLDTREAGGRTGSEACKQHRPIVFATLLPKWHYWARPQ
jgi:hypothetical protein